MIIILDTNFLIYCVKYKIDLLSELERICPGYKLVVPGSVVAELKGLEEKAAPLAFSILNKFVKQKKVAVIKSEKSADKAILELAKAANAVATMDRLLAAKLKKVGKRIIKVRQKKYLIMD